MPETFDLERTGKNLDTLLAICRRRGRVLVLMQNNPDPDSLASAAALRDLVAARLNKHVRIGYGGICGRAENRAMMDVLRIEAHQVTVAEVRKAKTVCLVDSQPQSGNNVLCSSRPADIVIDHHPLPKRNVWVAQLADVRPEYGATATILYEYVMTDGLKMTTNLATALFYGIRSDTQDLGREASAVDIVAFQALFRLADRKKLARIRRAPVPPDYFKVLNDSLTSCVVAGPTVISHIRADASPDMISEVSDLMLRLDGARVSVCYGLCGDVIHLSARRADARSDVARRVKRVVSRLGTGGGHRTMAGGQIPANNDPQARLELVRNRILTVFAPNREPQPLFTSPPAQDSEPSQNGGESPES